jgi:hypothetical protein
MRTEGATAPAPRGFRRFRVLNQTQMNPCAGHAGALVCRQSRLNGVTRVQHRIAHGWRIGIFLGSDDQFRVSEPWEPVADGGGRDSELRGDLARGKRSSRFDQDVQDLFTPVQPDLTITLGAPAQSTSRRRVNRVHGPSPGSLALEHTTIYEVRQLPCSDTRVRARYPAVVRVADGAGMAHQGERLSLRFGERHIAADLLQPAERTFVV